MKIVRLRFAVFCLCIFCFVCVPIAKPVLQFENTEKTTYYFYTSLIDDNIKNAKVIKNGDNSIVVCDYAFAKTIKNQLPQIYGESLRISNYTSQTLQNLLNKYSCDIVRFENFDGYKSMLCYDKTLFDYIIIDSQKINLQIAYNQTEINIGYPLILNGF